MDKIKAIILTVCILSMFTNGILGYNLFKMTKSNKALTTIISNTPSKVECPVLTPTTEKPASTPTSTKKSTPAATTSTQEDVIAPPPPPSD